MREKMHSESDAMLSGMIRKELGRDTNRRFLGRMPAFKTDGDMPQQFRVLLGELDRAEQNVQSRSPRR
jgi:hypothetical protein